MRTSPTELNRNIENARCSFPSPTWQSSFSRWPNSLSSESTRIRRSSFVTVEFVLMIVSVPSFVLAILSYGSNITDLAAGLGMDLEMLSRGVGSWI